MYAIPVTRSCIDAAALRFGDPAWVIKGVMATEGGWVGLKRRDPNGSDDYGPMQVNSLWMPRLAMRGISAYQLRYDGCLNVFVGGWILWRLHRRYANWGLAIGYYHSHQPTQALGYARKVIHNAETVPLRAVLRRADWRFDLHIHPHRYAGGSAR